MPFVSDACGNLGQALCEKSCPHETEGDGNNRKQTPDTAWLFQIHGSVCWSQWSRVCWHSPCSVCSGINPRVKSGRFMKILPDYEHMEYRDVYTCRTYPAAAASCTQHARDAAWSVPWLGAKHWGCPWDSREVPPSWLLCVRSAAGWQCQQGRL